MVGEQQRKNWEVYIIQAVNGALYTGIAMDTLKRFQEHADRKSSRGARFFRTTPPHKIVFREAHAARSAALKRESEIKKLSRREKLELIRSLEGEGEAGK